METISNRIARVIDHEGLTKTEFASRINVTQAYISKIVNTGATPSDRLLEDICEKFNVSESWLRTGEGEMLVQTNALKLDDYAKSNGLSRFEEKIIKAYMELPKDVRGAIVDRFKKAINDDDDIDREVEDYRRELEDEKRDKEVLLALHDIEEA